MPGMLGALVAGHRLFGIGWVDEYPVEWVACAGAGLGVTLVRIGAPGYGVRGACAREDGPAVGGTGPGLAGRFLSHAGFGVVPRIDHVRFLAH